VTCHTLPLSSRCRWWPRVKYEACCVSYFQHSQYIAPKAEYFPLIHPLLSISSFFSSPTPRHFSCVRMASGIQRATDGSFMHPTCTQRAADGPSHLHSCYVCAHVTSQWLIGIQRATNGSFAHPTSFKSGQRTLSPAPNRVSSRPFCTFAIAS
jgi:hypothetical protein